MIAKRFLESSRLEQPRRVETLGRACPECAVLSLSKGAVLSLSKGSVEGLKGHRRCSLLLLDM
jgi:hypothetical protein